ncbi:MAG: outer membrane beta-barrel protein [Bacteroidetes bacterium]|nr:outer membrane beta-barrel protein [Bacteroidota bacterium]
MKKLAFTILTFISLVAISQETDAWRFGIQWGTQGTRTQFAGGMENAHARFHQNKFDGAAFNIGIRYDLNKNWMGTIGLGFNTFGFNYALAENYSLYNPKSHFSGIKSEFSALEIPFMVFYKFNPNCKNAKWLIGGGFSQSFAGDQTITGNFQVARDGTTTSNYLNSTSYADGGMYTMLRFAIGREKVFKRGGILNCSLLFNCGLKNLAYSTVNYMIDGQNYTHDFKTNGNFCGLRLTYFFRPLKSKPAAKPAKTVNP